MKLVTIDPRMEFNANDILSTEMLQLGELTQLISCSEARLPFRVFCSWQGHSKILRDSNSVPNERVEYFTTFK
ncbi:hypothetical protein ISN45_Aa07g029500 [Arabidopsis thaliana x Arabidopsis arenosa]|uniref:Uncharacterized protein n=1 Tax=Arabidopsis thaliana x Arabidopsis arenosa TaxID=1240361 RepID=A0A8T1Y791_9BRAS|nr:hypothetical protein ISN45_Aa07g029500 [Arabidopsis thaliana x Arabidopsis arenosa]